MRSRACATSAKKCSTTPRARRRGAHSTTSRRATSTARRFRRCGRRTARSAAARDAAAAARGERVAGQRAAATRWGLASPRSYAPPAAPPLSPRERPDFVRDPSRNGRYGVGYLIAPAGALAGLADQVFERGPPGSRPASARPLSVYHAERARTQRPASAAAAGGARAPPCARRRRRRGSRRSRVASTTRRRRWSRRAGRGRLDDDVAHGRRPPVTSPTRPSSPPHSFAAMHSPSPRSARASKQLNF